MESYLLGASAGLIIGLLIISFAPMQSAAVFMLVLAVLAFVVAVTAAGRTRS